jgi:hypothetical protein
MRARRPAKTASLIPALRQSSPGDKALELLQGELLDRAFGLQAIE